MDQTTPLRRAIEIVGLTALARGLGVTHQAVRKWEQAGRLPRTEWTGESQYAVQIEGMTNGQVARGALLAAWPRVAAAQLVGTDGAPPVPAEAEVRDAAMPAA